jgi:hypothetical protein
MRQFELKNTNRFEINKKRHKINSLFFFYIPKSIDFVTPEIFLFIILIKYHKIYLIYLYFINVMIGYHKK